MCTRKHPTVVCSIWLPVNIVESQLGPFQDHETVGLVVVQCPYTVPSLYDKDRKDMGYIFYDTNFGNGKLGNGSGQVPRYWQQRWYPILKRQKQVMNDICKTGPFSYRDELLQVDLAASYTFRFNWGGDLLYHQVIKNPCDSSGLAPTDSGRFKRDVQVVSPCLFYLCHIVMVLCKDTVLLLGLLFHGLERGLVGFLHIHCSQIEQTTVGCFLVHICTVWD